MSKDTLGEFEFLVLLSMIRLGEDAYAVSIMEDIRERTRRKVSRAGVYVTLQRLEDAGLIASRLSEPLPQRGGKGRRLVEIRPEGAELVRQTRASIERMWDGLQIEGALKTGSCAAR